MLWDTARRTWKDERGQGREMKWILAMKKMVMAGWKRKRTSECFKRPKEKLPLP